MEVRVVFFRELQVGYTDMDSTVLPRIGDYIQVPLSRSLSIGTIVLAVSWKYEIVGTGRSVRVKQIEIKIQ